LSYIFLLDSFLKWKWRKIGIDHICTHTHTHTRTHTHSYTHTAIRYNLCPLDFHRFLYNSNFIPTAITSAFNYEFKCSQINLWLLLIRVHVDKKSIHFWIKPLINNYNIYWTRLFMFHLSLVSWVMLTHAYLNWTAVPDENFMETWNVLENSNTQYIQLHFNFDLL
jgi:hypothetical protein